MESRHAADGRDAGRQTTAAVLYYVRNSWGNKASKVTADQVKKIRAELGGRSEPHTAEELLKIPDAL